MRLILFCTLCCFIATTLTGQTISLDKGWQFKQVGTTKWFKANVPGTIHTDLLANKIIGDPFYRDNELKQQWISHTDWEYQKVFNLTANKAAQKNIQLVFEGLDTYAKVYLNDRLILSADNMFRTWKVNVAGLIKPSDNKLRIVFKNADAVVDSLAKASTLFRPSENNRHYARKAQYHFGWDWAPKLTTCGIWRSVKLVVGEEELNQQAKVKSNKRDDVQLIQEKDSIGQSFYFTVNGKPTFIKGANWIPADVFLPRITKAKYRQLLVAAKQANFNMLRVWGGGIYEDDYFYDLCDSLGIMVWQDFMFAGAMYPADSNFIENVMQEVIDNINRLKYHKSIVLWCGNNEIDEAWKNWGWQKQHKISSKDSAQLWNEYQKIFHDLLPGLVKQYDSSRPYISTSPLYGWGRQQSMTHGDSHYWGVWWGLEPIEKYKEKVPRFMSEYGMQAMPDFETFQQFTLPVDLDTSSAVLRAHQKHPTGYKTMATYMQQNKLHATNFMELIAATQEVQSKAIRVAITAHIDAAPRCMGTLFWQFNDCWPVTSWSVIDFYGRKKKAYYTVKELYKKPVQINKK